MNNRNADNRPNVSDGANSDYHSRRRRSRLASKADVPGYSSPAPTCVNGLDWDSQESNASHPSALLLRSVLREVFKARTLLRPEFGFQVVGASVVPMVMTGTD
jgi:hypothetical protein